jgi:hypothetical protein
MMTILRMIITIIMIMSRNDEEYEKERRNKEHKTSRMRSIAGDEDHNGSRKRCGLRHEDDAKDK